MMRHRSLYLFRISLLIAATYSIAGAQEPERAPRLPSELPSLSDDLRSKPPGGSELKLTMVTLPLEQMAKVFGAMDRSKENPYSMLADQEFITFLGVIESDSEMRKLKKRRCLMAINEIAAQLAQFRHGGSTTGHVFESADRVSESLLALDPPPSVRRMVQQFRLVSAKDIERTALKKMVSGSGTKHEVCRAAYLRMTVEIDILADKEQEVPRKP